MMIIETDLFAEDEREESIEFAKKYFPNVRPITFQEVISARVGEIPRTSLFRGSMALASKMGHRFEYANALNWMPEFKKHLLNKQYMFLDFASIVERADKMGIFDEEGVFVRPASPFKDFAGQAFYTLEKLKTEFNFAVKNKNISPNTICVAATAQEIREESRFVFVDNKLVDGCVYMKDDNLVEERLLPVTEATQLAAEIGRSDYFQNIFNYIVDIAIDYKGNPKLLEINGFQTASFYWCDRDKIYSAWADSLLDDGLTMH